MVVLVAILVTDTEGREEDLELLLGEPSEPSEGTPPETKDAPDRSSVGETEASKGRVIEEIVVTAQKREASIQDTPMSITALGGDDLDFRGVNDIDDLQFQVPNLNVGNREGNTIVTVRGVGLNVEFGSVESSVAIHVDGHYQPRVTTGILGMNDLERVEVLRGPQGTLYGRNATGGAINFLLRKPTDEFEGELRVGGGSFGKVEAVGIASGPVIPGFLNARGMAEVSRSNGFIDNQTLGETVGETTGYGGRLAFSLFPLDDLTVDVSGILRIDEGGPVVVMVNPPDPELEARLAIIPPTSPDEYVLGDIHAVKENRKPRGHRDTANLTTTVNWDTPWATVKSLTGFQYHYIDNHYDNDASARRIFFLNPRKDRSVSISQELNVSNTLDAWFGTRLDWIVGGFFIHENYRVFINIPVGDESTAAGNAGVRVYTSAEERIRAFAGFGDATLSLTPWLRFYGGVRMSFEDKDVLQNLRAFVLDDLQIPETEPLPAEIQALLPTHTCDDSRPSTSFDDVTPRFGIQIDTLDNLMIYAQRAEGFKSGGAGLTACNNLFDPEKVETDEIGVKSTWLEGLVTANFSIFRNDYTDFQVLKTTALEGPIVNADSASIEGAELEVVALPWEGVTMNVGASWLDAVYESFRDTDPANPDVGEQDLSGNELNRAPDYTVAAGLEYAWPVPMDRLGTLRLRGEWFRTADVTFRPYGDPDDHQDAYSLINAVVSLTNVSENVELRLFGRNLGDADYLVNLAGQQIGTKYGLPGPPRAIGSELIVRF